MDEVNQNHPLDSNPSSDLIDALGAEASEELSSAISVEISNAISKYSGSSFEESFEELDSSKELSDGNIYFTAFSYYNELARRAKKFNKHYCKANGLLIQVKRTLKDKKIGVKYAKSFNPFIYIVSIRQLNHDDSTKRILVKEAPTAQEAGIKTAYALGFLDSFEYKSISDLYYGPLISQVLANPKYLSAIRERNQHAEEIKQISEVTYVNKDRRAEWLDEISEKIQKITEQVKGAA
jgi:hypothetical protein